MKNKTWALYIPIDKRAMKADRKIYDYMYTLIPEAIRDKEALELATGPGLLAKHVAPAAKRMIASDYSDGMIAEARKGDNPPNLNFLSISGPHRNICGFWRTMAGMWYIAKEWQPGSL